jgi:serine/tyrosine/threonine adenylyltransferase
MPTFDNSFKTLPKFLYEEVKPTPLRNPRPVHVHPLKNELGLNLSDEEISQWLNGEKKLSGEQRIATRYAGHQFGVWAGQLGDGRAISLGEILTPKGRMEIQTKGSGLTPFSRMGDGKAVIRSSVREYLCSEAMAGLNIPTTRVLGLLTGEDPVYRETVERSALVARVFPSNLRFGHFELCYHFNQKNELKSLIDYTLNTFFQGLTLEEMLEDIVKRTATLLAHWQDVGFCHGVMNTDNMSVLGLTIDYGPFGFLEDTNLSHICNHSDHQGRYAYNKQPGVGLWNLERFLVCFVDYVPRDKLISIYQTYTDHFETAYSAFYRKKLGLLVEDPLDQILFSDILTALSFHSIDYTFFWRELSRYRIGDEASLKEIWEYYGKLEKIKTWLKRYDERLAKESSRDHDRHKKMLSHNPKYILRNYIAQEVIEEVEQGGNKKLQDWLKVLSSPHDEHPEFNTYARPTPPSLKNFEVSCSS